MARAALRHTLLAASLAWLAALVCAPVFVGAGRSDALRQTGRVTYWAASHLCHQKPERSFTTGSRQWAVCARCTGLYAGAPIGLLGAWWPRRGARAQMARHVVIAGGAIVALSVAVEWAGLAPVGNAARAVTAVPLSAATAWAAGLALDGRLW